MAARAPYSVGPSMRLTARWNRKLEAFWSPRAKKSGRAPRRSSAAFDGKRTFADSAMLTRPTLRVLWSRDGERPIGRAAP